MNTGKYERTNREDSSNVVGIKQYQQHMSEWFHIECLNTTIKKTKHKHNSRIDEIDRSKKNKAIWEKTKKE